MAQEQLMAEETGTYSPLDGLDTREKNGDMVISFLYPFSMFIQSETHSLPPQ